MNNNELDRMINNVLVSFKMEGMDVPIDLIYKIREKVEKTTELKEKKLLVKKRVK